MTQIPLMESYIHDGFAQDMAVQHFPANAFPVIHPVHWLHSHFAVGGWSPLQRLSGMLTAHMTRIAPHNGFTWHPHRGLEIYTWVLEGELTHGDSTGGEGVIHAGDFQRMFSGDYIEHQELNFGDDPARVIQIWFIADLEHRGLDAHYQQFTKSELPVRKVEDGDVYSLIGDDSPMDSHVSARLTATWLEAGGTTHIEAPREGEELFLYITDGKGEAHLPNQPTVLNQYDVILARPDIAQVTLTADSEHPLRFMSYYLKPFLE
jgi:quercetin 2,3-dioxygenase